ncbi:RND family transporter [Hydrogenoanaerobacterium sp.]|uniref:RND family transporter n=1 Tax=Hydrogenoanaerobacterium sp. TaxID=2953763 RepID=UPI0037BFE8CA
MERLARWIVKCRVLILIMAVALLIPAAIGYIGTYVNYDILTYLPDDLESMVGQGYLENDFNMAGTAMITVEHMATNDLLALKEELAAIPGVDEVLWQDDVLDASVPAEMLPEEIRSIYYNENATMMMVTFTDKSASDSTMKALEQINATLKENCFMGGMSAIVADTKTIAENEMPFYVVVAVVLSVVVLMLGMQSWLVPFIFITGIGFAVVYNLGSNIFLGQVCYITKSLAAVLQLGVTMDFSIFLLHRYDEEKENGMNSEDAMVHAIVNTFTSISGSSLTTIAGFLAMCTMSLALGADIGIVMAKGVVLGVLSTVIILPALILFFDKPIHKYTHRTFIPKLTKLSDFVIKHHKSVLVVAVLLFVPFAIAQSKTDVYYTLTDSLPADLPSVMGTNELKKQFDMATSHFIIVDDSVEGYQISDMCKQIEKMDGITSVVAYEKFLGAGVPDEFIPGDMKDSFAAGGKKMFMVNTSMKPATPELSKQLDDINALIKSYDNNAVIAGEGALTNDLVRVSDQDFKNVNISSIVVVFFIIAIVFKSISIPVLLVAAIEFAIMINMGVPYFTGTTIPFIASIVIGTIQLGATVDYAILMTTRFQEERRAGHGIQEAVKIAAETSSQSIITSGLSFFAATMGVALVSKIELIKSLCLMLARGAVISMVVILLVMPAILMVFGKLIEKTTIHFLGKPEKLSKERAVQ